MILSSTSGIKNNPTTYRDTLASVGMLGHSKRASQGKTTRTKSDVVSVATKKPDDLRTTRHFCNNAELSTDDFLINNVPFSTSSSAYANCETVSAVGNLKCHNLQEHAKVILRSHAAKHFRTIISGVDAQLKSLQDRING